MSFSNLSRLEMQQQSVRQVPAQNPNVAHQNGGSNGNKRGVMQQQSAQRILPAPLMNPIIAHQRGVPMGDNGVKIMD
jgi:hypothetical protein